MILLNWKKFFNYWSGFKPNTEAGVNKLSDVVGLFSVNFFTKRLEPDYVSRMPEYLMELVGILQGMGEFWAPPEEG